MDRFQSNRLTHRIEIDDPVLLVTRGDAVTLHGHITNNGSASWCTDRVEAMRVKVGARLYAMTSSQEIIDEIRCDLPSPLMPVMQKSEFALVLDSNKLEPGAYKLVVDAVYEGRYWFADMGARDHPVRVFVRERVGAG
jgi:hypothetical protein